MGEPAEVAAAVLYLASPEAGFTTGEVLRIDGGYLTRSASSIPGCAPLPAADPPVEQPVGQVPRRFARGVREEVEVAP